MSQPQKSEAFYYNALAAANDGEYAKLKICRARGKSWEDEWKNRQQLFKTVDAEKEWQKLSAAGVRLIMNDEPEYPALLREIPAPPMAIYIKGKLPQESPAIAIVGTRKATTEGARLAEKFAGELARAGVAIISGLALGIDAAAHKGALGANGATVAVLACGLDSIYPAQNAPIGERVIKNGGAIISEYPIGSVAYPNRFLERNRIVAGLSRGVLVIEAPERSGSLATTKFALEQNRDVYVIPGPVTHANYAGSHALIRAGAMLVTSTAEILEDMGLAANTLQLANAQNIAGLSDEELKVYEMIKQAGSALSVDKIIEISKLPAYAVNRALTFLVLKDIIKESGGGYETA